MEKRLYRDELNKKVAGVCAGLAEYLNVDVTIVRVIFVLALVLKGVGALPYIVLWIVLPKKPYFINDANVDYTVPPPSQPFNPFADRAAVPPFAMPPKKRSNAGLIAGIALVLFGSFFLLDEFDVLPFLDIEQLWPVILVVIGIVMIFKGKNNNVANNAPWQTAEKKEDIKINVDPIADKPENE